MGKKFVAFCFFLLLGLPVAQADDKDLDIFQIAKELGVHTNDVKSINETTVFEAPRFDMSAPQVVSSELLDFLFQGEKYYQDKMPSSSEYAIIRIELEDTGHITSAEILSSPFKSNTMAVIDEIKKTTLIPAKINGKSVPCVGIMRSFQKQKDIQKNGNSSFGSIYWLIPDLTQY